MTRGGNLTFGLGVLAIVAAVGLAYTVLLADSTAPVAVTPPAVAPSAPAATLLPLKGTVEVQQGDAPWKAAAKDTPLPPGTIVRTGADGAAEVKYGDDVQVELQADSQVGVERAGSRIVRFRVQEGGVTADVKAKDGRLVEFLGVDDDAKVTTTNGRVHVLADATGRLQAAVSRGSADVSAQGQTVNLAAGQQTVVHKGSAPQPPQQIPTSLLLQVTWPVAGPTAKKRQRIAGETTPLAHLRIGDQRILADAKGHFEAVVELQEGANAIRIVATDVTGRTQEQASPTLVLDTRAPTNAFETDPNMWQQGAKSGHSSP